MVSTKAQAYNPRGMQIQFSGDFQLEKVYRVVKSWFGRNRFKYHENRYKDKPSSFQGSEMDIWLYGEYNKDEYFRYFIKVDFHLWEYHEREVVINGKKQLMGNGKIQIDILPDVIFDWKNKFPPKPNKDDGWTKKLHHWFGNLLFTIKYNEILVKEVGFLDPLAQTLTNELKVALGMESVR